MDEDSYWDLVDLARHLADSAGAVARQHFRRTKTASYKLDRSLVTEADREGESLMRRLIAERYPDHGIVGEEFPPERPGADLCWFLDPIDGTASFVTGKPLFGTLIGLMAGDRPILGVIDMPALEERWIGGTRHPTLWTHPGDGPAAERTCTVRRCAGLGEAVLYCTSPRMFAGPDRAAFERLADAVSTPLFGADCYAYGLLAAGSCDLVVEGGLGPDDVCALQAVVEAAGGVFTDWQGHSPGRQPDGRVIAAGDPAVHTAALDLLRGG